MSGARDLLCETCGAQPGKPCLRTNGSEAHTEHVARATGGPRRHRSTKPTGLHGFIASFFGVRPTNAGASS